MAEGAPAARPPRLSPLLRQLRAAFVAFHIVAISLDAAPSPAAGMNRSAWREATVQRELRAWADRLHQDPEGFEERLWTLAKGFVEVRRVAMTPFRPYLELVGARQSWQMFVAPHRWPTRLQIQVARGPVAPSSGEEGWETLFEERSETHAWRAELFGRERVRASVFRWGWPNYAEPYRNGCQALAELAFADDPAIQAVRCRFSRVKSPSPDQVRAGDKLRRTWLYLRVVERP